MKDITSLVKQGKPRGLKYTTTPFVESAPNTFTCELTEKTHGSRIRSIALRAQIPNLLDKIESVSIRFNNVAVEEVSGAALKQFASLASDRDDPFKTKKNGNGAAEFVAVNFWFSRFSGTPLLLDHCRRATTTVVLKLADPTSSVPKLVALGDFLKTPASDASVHHLIKALHTLPEIQVGANDKKVQTNGVNLGQIESIFFKTNQSDAFRSVQIEAGDRVMLRNGEAASIEAATTSGWPYAGKETGKEFACVFADQLAVPHNKGISLPAHGVLRFVFDKLQSEFTFSPTVQTRKEIVYADQNVNVLV